MDKLQEYAAWIKDAHHLNVCFEIPFAHEQGVLPLLRNADVEVPDHREGHPPIELAQNLDLTEPLYLDNWFRDNIPSIRRIRVRLLLTLSATEEAAHHHIGQAFEAVIPMLARGLEVAVGVEHYNVATSGTLCTDAALLGMLSAIMAEKGLQVSMWTDEGKKYSEAGNLKVMKMEPDDEKNG